MNLLRWPGWFFYQHSLEQCPTTTSYLNHCNLNDLLYTRNISDIQIYLSRNDRGINLSVLCQTKTGITVWFFWERAQGVMRQTISLQYKIGADKFVHLGETYEVPSEVINTLLGLLGKGKLVVAFRKFIQQESIPITWRKTSGLLVSLRNSNDKPQSVRYPINLHLELYQSGNKTNYRGKRIDKIYYYNS